ncbi:MAG: O-antigen ligase family protein [Rubellimicrobium sp.]|nr:O-antigen ligase family protein [Rubellimicrobium sp.]
MAEGARPARALARAETRPARALARAETRIGVALALLAPVAALPVAGARPAWWLLGTALIALGGLALQAGRLRFRLRTGDWPPVPAGIAPPFVLLGLLVPVWGAVQALPVAGPALSLVPGASLLGALRLSGYLMFVMLVAALAGPPARADLMARILFWGIVAQAVWALVALRLLGDAALWGDKTQYRGVATGSFVNRNSLATFLGLGLVQGAALGARPGGRAPVAAGMAAILVALLATQSRLGVAAGVAGLGVTAALLWARPRRRLLLAGAGLALGVAVVAGNAGLAERLLAAGPEGRMRLELYRQILGMIAARPFTGWGLDAFGAAFAAFRAPPLPGAFHYDLAHNSYLALWAEMGVIAGSLPPLILAGAGVVLWRRRHAPDGPGPQAAAGIGALVLGGLHSLGDFSLEIPAVTLAFLSVLGPGMARRGAGPD